MKRKTLAQLEEEIKLKDEAIKRLEGRIYDTQERVTTIMKGTRLRYDDSRLKLEDIPNLLAEFKGRSTGEGEIMNGYNAHIDNENAKLWYMVRVAMKDETLKPVPYVEHHSGKDNPFNCPSFDR